jgi:murein DD-endopeptidase MepM/ murein hydrolase activator NlpD
MAWRWHRLTVSIEHAETSARRLTLSLRAACTILGSLVVTPLLIGAGAKWSASDEVARLRAANAALQVENGNFRATTGELTTQIQELETVLNDLGARAKLDPSQKKAMQKLPAVVKASAAGGTRQTDRAISSVFASLTNPEDTFGALRDLLRGLEVRLSYMRRDVERQEQLAAATPSIWPAHGWLTGTFGGRADPFTGEPGFHQGLDISTGLGQPVYATADGTVESAGYSGDFGNLIVLKHDFGLSTRYGHLSRFNVMAGGRVRRGDVIGYVGSTGRSTGAHLHYEILANGKLINPLRLLTKPTQRTAQ